MVTMDGNDDKWLMEGGDKVKLVNEVEEEEDNSLASNSSGSDSSFADSSMDSSRVEVEDVTDEDCAERRFQVDIVTYIERDFLCIRPIQTR